MANMMIPGGRHQDPSWGLYSFYSNDSPWVPPNLSGSGTQQNHHIAPSDIQRVGNPAAFNGWRSAQPSECGTHAQGYLPSDSGYESRPKHDDMMSVYEDVDRGQDTQSITGQLHDITFFGRDVPLLHDPWPATPVPVAHSGGNDKQMRCPGCQAICKTKSELKHRKAFKCEVPGCTRKDGFGTLNDLERHRTSVHRELFGGGQKFSCNIDQCAAKEKMWPRADNFRQHLKRVHGRAVSSDEDLKEFTVEAQPVRTVQEDLSGVGSVAAFTTGPAGSWEQQEELQLPQTMDMDDFVVDPSLTNVAQPAPNITVSNSMEMATSRIPIPGQVSSVNPMDNVHPTYNQIQTQHAYVQPREISKPAPSKNTEGRPGIRSTGPKSTQPPSSVGSKNGLRGEAPSRPEQPSQEALKDPAASEMDCDSPPEATVSFESKSSQGSLGMEQHLSVSHSSLEKSGEQEVRSYAILDTVPKHLIEKYLKEKLDNDTQKSTPPPTNSTSTAHSCPVDGCSKSFARNCELKKHMKRHAKPYGCTFPMCKKKFGSKNDWKRHENSQHFQVDVWKCDVKRPDDTGNGSQTCGKACHRRETFKNHLQKEHKIENSSRIDEALERCRFGRTCDARFWCGFCVNLIETTKKGNNSKGNSAKGNSAWNERFDHIDAHYSGRDNGVKRDISEWKNVDPDLPDIDLTASPDDSSDAESDDEAAVSPPASSGQATLGESRKRGPADDDEQPSRKRTKHQTLVQSWSCVSNERRNQASWRMR
ncbi:C2H2 type zinc finger domain protein [Colletotrichum musicola]|uniref:C2H2 type zinc finger domain protein n=1 Tax=Colletotrichum musicola TaxID=2175873 RepID=A0A8H6NIA3_9PEZI|nr:C2H2 type zinc finger domain protein [Colletotrichum musicola]